MQRSIKPMHQPIAQLDEAERASLVNAILSKLGLTREVEEPDAESGDEQGRAPTSAVNVIMGRLGLANPASEPEGNENVLARGLTDPAWAVRVATVQKLGRMGMQAPLELLLVALRDEQSSVRSAAARALSRNPRPAALPALIATLTDSEWVVRTEVARALGKLADPEALAGLLVAARDPDAAVRSAALLALGETGVSEVVELLNAALQDEDWSVREAATLALAQFTESAAIPPLLNARLDQDPAVRAAAEEGLQRLYPDIDATPPPPSDSFAQWLARIEAPHAESTPFADQASTAIFAVDPHNPQVPLIPPAKHTEPAFSSEPSVRRRRVTRLLALVETRDIPDPMPTTDETTEIFAASLFAQMQHTTERPAARSIWSHKLARLAEALVALLILAALIVTWLLIANRPDIVPVPQISPSAFTIYRGHTSSVEKLAWSPDGRLMASADNRGAVQIWQVSNGHTLAKYMQAGKVLALNWIDASTALAVYGGPGPSLQIQEISVDTTPLVVQTIFRRSNLPGTPEAAAWSPDNSTLAFDTGHGEVQIWAMNPLTSQYLLTLPAPSLNQLTWSPDSRQIATASNQGLLAIWNASTGDMVADLVNGPQSGSVAWIACGPSGNGLTFAYTQGALVEWCPAQHDQATSVLLSAQTYNLKNSHNLNVGAIALSANGNQILLATSDGLVQARDAASGNLIYVYAGHSAQVNALAWSPNGRSIASASVDTTVQIWQEG